MSEKRSEREREERLTGDVQCDSRAAVSIESTSPDDAKKGVREFEGEHEKIEAVGG